MEMDTFHKNICAHCEKTTNIYTQEVCDGCGTIYCLDCYLHYMWTYSDERLNVHHKLCGLCFQK